jgi:hypothetical protein
VQTPAAATGTTGGMPKPTSPKSPRRNVNPIRMIALNTPAEGIHRPAGDSTTAGSQTPEATGRVE